MFGLRGNKPRRKVHSNTLQTAKPADVRPQADITKVFGRQPSPTGMSSKNETTEDHYYDDNSSLDMSLYTTKSKSTVRYPSQLLNYDRDHDHDHDHDDYDDANDDDVSTDGISCAPTEFTTEIALNRYLRLGGDWRPPDPLHCPHPLSKATPVTPEPLQPQLQSQSQSQSAQTKTMRTTHRTTRSSDSQLPSPIDSGKMSSTADFSMESDCEQTTCSLLPATAKMAQFVHRDSYRVHQQEQKRLKMPQVTCRGEQGASCQKVQSSRHPIDLDASFTDASSGGSASNSWIVSPSGVASPRKQGQTLLFPMQDLRFRNVTKNEDDNLGIVSVEDSSSASSSKLSLHYGTTSTPHRENGPGSVTLSFSSGSWRGKSLQSPDTFSVDCSRDDDTYGYSMVSTQHSTATSNSRNSAYEVRRVELFKQWDDSYQSASSILSQSPAKPGAQIPSRDDESTQRLTVTSPAVHLKSNGVVTRATTSVAWGQFATISPPPCRKQSPRSNEDHGSAEVDSLDRLVATTLSKHDDHQQPDECPPRKLVNTLLQNRMQELPKYLDTKPVFMAKPFVPTQTSKDLELKQINETMLSVHSITKEESNTSLCTEQETNLLNASNSPSTSSAIDQAYALPRPRSQTNLSRQDLLPSRKIEYYASSYPLCYDHVPTRQSSGSTLMSACPELEDDDTFGFSTTSPAPIPRISDDDTLGFGSLASPVLGDEDEREYVWMDHDGDFKDEDYVPIIQQKIRRELLNETFQETMHSISFARRSHESLFGLSTDDEDDTHAELDHSGTILLTESELKKHLAKVQDMQPLPSSEIWGFDSWKLHQEEKQRYFAKLEAAALTQKQGSKCKIDRRQPGQSHRSNPLGDRRQRILQQPFVQHKSHSFGDKCVDSTQSAMDRSMDSSIPTIDDRKSTPRQGNTKSRRCFGWGWLHSGKKNKKKGKTENSTKSTSLSTERRKHRKERLKAEDRIVSLSQFMQISENDKVAEFSMSPLHKDGIISIGTTTIPDCADTDAATMSHCLDDSELGTRSLVASYLDDERQKQRKAECERKNNDDQMGESAKGKQVVIPSRCQLDQNRQNPRDDGKLPSNQVSLKASPTTENEKDKEVVVHNISISSKQSVDSSMKSGSGQILSLCVVCNTAERTHVAMPCMHFYFCEECVDTLYKAEYPTCPVCSTKDVVFTRVYT